MLPTRSAQIAVVSPTSTSTPDREKTSVSVQTIQVGLLLPLSGPLAYIGEGYQMGINLALKEISGQINGVAISTIPADTESTVQGTKTAFGVISGQPETGVIIGPGTSPDALAILLAIKDARVPVLDATSTDPVILSQVRENDNAWYFHLNADENILARAFSKKLAQTYSSIAVVSEDDPFSRQVAAEYVARFRADGLSVIREDNINSTTTEFRPLLLQIRQSRPDAMFLIMQEDSCAILMRQYKNSFTNIPVYSRGACTSNLFRQITQDDSQIGSGIIEAVIFSELQDPDLAAKFEKEYGQPLTGHRMAGYYAMKYAVIPALKSIIESGKTVSPAAIQKALEQLQEKTPLGLLSFDSNHQAYLDAGLVTNDSGTAKLTGMLPTK